MFTHSAYISLYTQGRRVGRVHTIFSIPDRFHSQVISNPQATTLSPHLAYIEWFAPFRQNPEPHHNLFSVKRPPLLQRQYSIVPVNQIVRSVHLIPRFGPQVDRSWTSSNVLDECDSFFLNQFSDRNAYITLI